MKTASFLGVKALSAPPTKSHRPAVWECMLGTVYALNAEGECRYFDYDHEAALAFSGVTLPGAEPRVARVKEPKGWIRKGATDANPRRGRLVLWAKR